MEFIIAHWSEIALIVVAAAGSYTALTETKADDKVVNVLSRILQAIVFGKSRKK